MSNEQIPRLAEETIYYRGQVSGLLPIFKTVRATAILAAFIFLFTRPFLEPLMREFGEYRPWFWILALVIWAAHVAWVWWGWDSVRYMLTNKKIKFERGRFGKSIKNIELWRIREILFHRTFLEAIFGIGRITLISKDLTGPFSVVGPINNAVLVYESLSEAREIAIKERGVMAVEG